MRSLPLVLDVGRPLLLEAFADGSGYAFDLANPSGVKYLPPAGFDALSRSIAKYGNPPRAADVDADPILRQLARHGLIGRPPPTRPEPRTSPSPSAITVWFHIVNACNLSCKYCYIPHLEKGVTDAGSERNYMSADTAERSVRALFDFCRVKSIPELWLKFAGGEPSLNRPVIERACAAARALSAETGIAIGFSILTNGVFDDPEFADFLAAHNFGVAISIDGAARDHDRVRFTVRKDAADTPWRRSGTWPRVLETIISLQQRGIDPYVLCTVSEHNRTSLRELAAFCFERRVGVRLSPVRDRTTYRSAAVRGDIAAEMVALYCWGGDLYPASMPIQRYLAFGEWNLQKKKTITCGTCRSTLALDQTGGVSSCQMRLDVPFGHVDDEGAVIAAFDRMRAHDDYAFVVAPESRTGDCATCRWLYVCAGGCPEHARNAVGTTNAASPWCDVYLTVLPAFVRAVATQLKRAVDARTARPV